MDVAAEERRRLHARARAFIGQSMSGVPDETFDALGLAIAAYQADHVPAYARLLAASGVHPTSEATLGRLPAMPTDAFRFARIAAHTPEEDVAVFRTSGTTGGARGEQCLSTTETYEEAALAWGKWGLFFDEPPQLQAIVIGPRESDGTESSLEFMLRLFARRFASRVHHVETTAEVPIDAAAIGAIGDAVSEAGGPAIVMATSFAFVHVIDALAGVRVPLPSGSRAMHTGGFKGRSREVAPGDLRSAIATAFGLEPNAVVGEYGMTELSSQLYEGVLRAGRREPTPSAQHGVFVPPPWLRVVAVDPDTLAPRSAGEAGILRFEDLANVDGAVAIQTADLGRTGPRGVELLGRAKGATPRGCSLAIEELFTGS